MFSPSTPSPWAGHISLISKSAIRYCKNNEKSRVHCSTKAHPTLSQGCMRSCQCPLEVRPLPAAPPGRPSPVPGSLAAPLCSGSLTAGPPHPLPPHLGSHCHWAVPSKSPGCPPEYSVAPPGPLSSLRPLLSVLCLQSTGSVLETVKATNSQVLPHSGSCLTTVFWNDPLFFPGASM